MDPIPPEALLAEYPGPMRDIGEWLRAVVHRAIPEAIERVRPGWRLIGYDLPVGPRRTVYFAMIWAEPVHVHLGFEQGVLMDDPRGVLEGRGITKQVRWVTLTPDAMVDEAVLAELLHEAARVASMSRGERVARAMALDERRER
ncbi:MAG: DUF1801 domain-containing protein [Chloroflexota bacterium]